VILSPPLDNNFVLEHNTRVGDIYWPSGPQWFFQRRAGCPPLPARRSFCADHFFTRRAAAAGSGSRKPLVGLRKPINRDSAPPSWQRELPRGGPTRISVCLTHPTRSNSSRRVGQGRESCWWGCANRSTVIPPLRVGNASCRERSPTRISVCLTHPTRSNSSRRVGQGRESCWWGCANQSTVIRPLIVSKTSCRDRSPTRTAVCLTHPTR
jgi:hypothetical protein